MNKILLLFLSMATAVFFCQAAHADDAVTLKVGDTVIGHTKAKHGDLVKLTGTTVPVSLTVANKGFMSTKAITAEYVVTTDATKQAVGTEKQTLDALKPGGVTSKTSSIEIKNGKTTDFNATLTVKVSHQPHDFTFTVPLQFGKGDAPAEKAAGGAATPAPQKAAPPAPSTPVKKK